MQIAITRPVSSSIANAALTFMSRDPIDFDKASQQHRQYEEWLRQSGLEVITLPEQSELPDAVFVEDPAIVVDEIAIITPMGIASREKEIDSLKIPLANFRELAYIKAPARLEGGDVLQVDKIIFVGLSTRTNRQGIDQLSAILGEHGYIVLPVVVSGCLHLKTGATYIGNNTILINSKWVDAGAFRDFALLEVPDDEPFGANTLRVGDKLLLAAAYPKTKKLLLNAGFAVDSIDISELAKAEAGLTCMSIIFRKE